jgi:hypothetical protein
MGKEVSATVGFLKQGDEAIRQEMSSYRAHAEAVAPMLMRPENFSGLKSRSRSHWRPAYCQPSVL